MDLLIKDIYNYAEVIGKTFVNINELVLNTSEYYNDDSGDLFRKKFESLSVIFDDISSKLLNYTNYLANVKIKYQDSSIDLKSNIIKDTDNIIDYGKE